MTNERIIELLENSISYLWEIWNNESCDDIENNFKRLGFTYDDMKYLGINDDLNCIREVDE